MRTSDPQVIMRGKKIKANKIKPRICKEFDFTRYSFWHARVARRWSQFNAFQISIAKKFKSKRKKSIINLRHKYGNANAKCIARIMHSLDWQCERSLLNADGPGALCADDKETKEQ